MTGWYSYLVSLDLGQSQDFSALSLIEIPIWRPDPGVWDSPSDMEARHLAVRAYAQGTPPSPRPLHVRTLRRFPLGTSYPDIVRSVVRLLQSGAVAGKGVALLVDQTGVGAPVLDLFKETGVRPVGVTITGGQRVTRDHDGYHVPKQNLVSALQLSLQSGQLKISPKLEHAATFLAEARDFRVTVNLATGHESFAAWRESTHDDLILSIAMAAWFFSYRVDRQRHATAVSTAQERFIER